MKSFKQYLNEQAGEFPNGPYPFPPHLDCVQDVDSCVDYLLRWLFKCCYGDTGMSLWDACQSGNAGACGLLQGVIDNLENLTGESWQHLWPDWYNVSISSNKKQLNKDNNIIKKYKKRFSTDVENLQPPGAGDIVL